MVCSKTLGQEITYTEAVVFMPKMLNGHLSDDSLRNVKYLFVANITIATRFAIEGGLDSEIAYNISDLYINKMDLCQTVDEVLEVHREMFAYFTKQMYVDLNQSYLSTLFKKEMNISISDYILKRRIDTAKNMLRYSEYPAAQISEILAFSSQSHFIRCFKKLTGTTPNEYRKLHYYENFEASFEEK